MLKTVLALNEAQQIEYIWLLIKIKVKVFLTFPLGNQVANMGKNVIEKIFGRGLSKHPLDQYPSIIFHFFNFVCNFIFSILLQIHYFYASAFKLNQDVNNEAKIEIERLLGWERTNERTKEKKKERRDNKVVIYSWLSFRSCVGL